MSKVSIFTHIDVQGLPWHLIIMLEYKISILMSHGGMTICGDTSSRINLVLPSFPLLFSIYSLNFLKKLHLLCNIWGDLK